MITLPTEDIWSLDDFTAFCIDHNHTSLVTAMRAFFDCEHLYIQTDTPPAVSAFNKHGQQAQLRQLI